MSILALLAKLSHHRDLAELSLDQLLLFTRLTCRLRDHILLVQPASSYTPNFAPVVLPPSIIQFLTNAVSITPGAIEAIWDHLADSIWFLTWNEDSTRHDEAIFREHGWDLGITAISLYPPTRVCLNPNCSRLDKPLGGKEKNRIVVFTLKDGVRAGYSVNLYCFECQTNYHNNYAVQYMQRGYYEDMASYMEVGKHQFIEVNVIRLWISQMLVGNFSATNCARSYDIALSRHGRGLAARRAEVARELKGDMYGVR